MIDVATFVASYPEFGQAPPSLIAAKLAEAQTLVYGPQWNAGGDPARDLTEQATFLYAADFLYNSPFSRHMARVGEGGAKDSARSDQSPYKLRLDRLKLTAASGWRVI